MIGSPQFPTNTGTFWGGLGAEELGVMVTAQNNLLLTGSSTTLNCFHDANCEFKKACNCAAYTLGGLAAGGV